MTTTLIGLLRAIVPHQAVPLSTLAFPFKNKARCKPVLSWRIRGGGRKKRDGEGEKGKNDT